jgi:hypothetical protein
MKKEEPLTNDDIPDHDTEVMIRSNLDMSAPPKTAASSSCNCQGKTRPRRGLLIALVLIALAVIALAFFRR